MNNKSGLQRQVLALYRRALRIPPTKPQQAQANFRLLIRHTFRTQALAISPKQITAVEHLLRKAKKTVEMWEASTVRDVSVSGAMREWENHAGVAWRRDADTRI